MRSGTSNKWSGLFKNPSIVNISIYFRVSDCENCIHIGAVFRKSQHHALSKHGDYYYYYYYQFALGYKGIQVYGFKSEWSGMTRTEAKVTALIFLGHNSEALKQIHEARSIYLFTLADPMTKIIQKQRHQIAVLQSSHAFTRSEKE